VDAVMSTASCTPWCCTNHHCCCNPAADDGAAATAATAAAAAAADYALNASAASLFCAVVRGVRDLLSLLKTAV